MLFVPLCLTALITSTQANVLDSAAKFHANHRRYHDLIPRDDSNCSTSRNESSFRFLNDQSQKYKVDSLPEVDYDIGELYSGLIPINNTNTSNALFFIFQPTIGAPVDEVTIYLNGGPGWSSFEGFFQENGLFTWKPGTFRPVQNLYSWVNETNMLWVDQPVGTGFSIGTPVATNEQEVAQEFISFFKNFEQVFGIKNFKIYVTGESFAGRYVPYISAAMLDAKDTEYYNLSGALVYDPCIGDYNYVAQQIPAVPFAHANNNVLGFNSTFLAHLDTLYQTCGYANWTETYLQFPPPGIQPPVHFNHSNPHDIYCSPFTEMNTAVFDVNPCFNIYAVNELCPLPWDVLGHPGQFNYVPVGAAPTYPNRPDVKKALHAPNITWVLDQNTVPVLVAGGGGAGPEGDGDTSLDPIQHVLPQVIEATNRVLISNGDLDMIIITNGTLLSIQNMTWNGALGFQTAPSEEMVVDIPDLQYRYWFNAGQEKGKDGPQGVVGKKHYERGLMWAETYQGTHTQPESQPRASFKHLQWLLGRIDDL